MKKKYFLNANIIDPHNSIEETGGLIINEVGKIEAVGKKVNNNNIPSREKYIDLKGKCIIPGLVDMRVFVGEPGFEYKENFRTLTQAALAGGVTSVVTMPNTKPLIDNVSMVDFIIRRGRDKSNLNIFPAACLTREMAGKEMVEFGLLNSRGIIAFTDPYQAIQNTEIMSRIMDYASDMGVLIMQHVEDYELSKDGCINEGEIATRLGLQSIPSIAEKIIIERDLTLLEEFPCRYHINQISSQKSVEVIKKNKKNGKKFTTGVSINHLSLNDNDIGDFKTFLKFAPPLRSENDRKSLITAINSDLIDVIVSAHKPEDEESKRLPFAQAASGSIGVETLLPLALELYHNKSVDLLKLIELITANPAKILKINKGTLKVGSDADICIFDPDKPWKVDANKLKSKSKNAAIENKSLQGKVLMTFLKGQLVYS